MLNCTQELQKWLINESYSMHCNCTGIMSRFTDCFEVVPVLPLHPNEMRIFFTQFIIISLVGLVIMHFKPKIYANIQKKLDRRKESLMGCEDVIKILKKNPKRTYSAKQLQELVKFSRIALYQNLLRLEKDARIQIIETNFDKHGIRIVKLFKWKGE